MLAGAHERLVGLELRAELLLSEGTIVELGSLGLWLGDGAGVEAEFDLLAPLVVCYVGSWDTLHAEDLHLVAIPSWKCVFDTGQSGREGEAQATRR